MVATAQEATHATKVNDYLTNGKMLVLVIGIDENGLMVEDALDERPFRLGFDDVDEWTPVPLQEID